MVSMNLHEDTIYKRLIAKARKKHGDRISPTAYKRSFRECFTENDGVMIFWYNTEDMSTHVVTERIEVKNEGK